MATSIDRKLTGRRPELSRFLKSRRNLPPVFSPKALKALVAKLSVCGFATVIALRLGIGVASATTISTIADQLGTFSFFGEPNIATIGQTFVAPTDNILDSFTFMVDDLLDPDSFDFRGYVYAWDDTNLHATGSLLFESTTMSSTNNAGSDGLEFLTVSTGGLELVSGAGYIVFFSSSRVFDGTQGHAAIGQSPTNPYSGGNLYFLSNGDDASKWTQDAWSGLFYDLAFELRFSPSPAVVPIPAALPLFVSGLISLSVIARRRRKAT